MTETDPSALTRSLPLPRGLFVLLLLYGGMAVLAGVLAFKQVALGFGGLAIEAGIFCFLLLVAASSTVAQRYGERTANQLVWWGFVPLAVSIVLIALVLALPPSPDMPAGNLTAFDTVLGQTPRIMAAGPAAYLVSLTLNVWLFSRLRGRSGSGGVALAVRGAVASALSQAIDSLVFITAAFYGEFPIADLLIGQIIAKVVLSIVLVPVLIAAMLALAKALDREEPTLAT
jgi:uncharacterized integral membrane protein (TIGR00697 family)